MIQSAAGTSREAAAMTEPQIAGLPPMLEVRTRTSIPHLVIGNAVLTAVVVASFLDGLSWWYIVGTIAVAVVALLGTDKSTELTGRYKRARLAELSSHFLNEASAEAQVRRELPKGINTAPTVDSVALPMVVLTLVFAGKILLDVYAALNAYPAIVQWFAAIVMAAIGWLGSALLWAGANMVAAKVPDQAFERQAAPSEALATSDTNDMQIIRQTVHLESLGKRIDTYTLEGALLSALSFSSFISLLFSDKDYKPSLRGLLSELGKGVGGADPVQTCGASPTQFAAIWNQACTHLVPLIGLSMLVCATTFLGVLVARLRFNEGYRDAESCLKIAAKFNEKEEQAIEREDEAKAAIYADAIDRSLKSAEESERGLSMTVLHMRLSRNLGIVAFMITLALCGLFFAPAVTMIVGGFFMVAALLGYVDRLARHLRRQELFGL
jgi:hypothetical protein